MVYNSNMIILNAWQLLKELSRIEEQIRRLEENESNDKKNPDELLIKLIRAKMDNHQKQ